MSLVQYKGLFTVILLLLKVPHAYSLPIYRLHRISTLHPGMLQLWTFSFRVSVQVTAISVSESILSIADLEIVGPMEQC